MLLYRTKSVSYIMFELDSSVMSDIQAHIKDDVLVMDSNDRTYFCILCSGGVADGCSRSCNNGCDGGCSATCRDDCEVSCDTNCSQGCHSHN